MSMVGWIAAVQTETAWFNALILVLTDSYWVVTPFLFLLLAYFQDARFHRSWRWVTWRRPVVFLATLAVAYLFSSYLKTVFDAARPCMVEPSIGIGGCETDAAFPSNHATYSAAMLPFFWRRKKWFAAVSVYAALVMFSRVYLGQHWPRDVAAGAVLGAGVGYLGWNLYQRCTGD